MKVCLACGEELPRDGWGCDACGWKADEIKGVPIFAPHISGVSEGYDPAWYEELASLEAGNFWFVGRNRLIQWLIEKYLPAKGSYLELGCGTGFVLQMLQQSLPGWSIAATEAQPEGIEFARRRVPESVSFYQMDACAIPFRNEFDAVGAFDVIEHIRDDVAAIAQVHSALKLDGLFVLSVPQHMFLWSKYDEVGCHFRRYSAPELEGKLEAAGFKILVSTSFNSLLLPLMMLSRALKKEDANGKVDVLAELRLSPLTNRLLSIVLNVEFFLIRLGLRFSMGGSRIVVAQKTAG